MTQTPKQLKGDFAEDLACDYLCTQGLTLLKRNYRCRLGEIDLIMQHQETRVFVEVRFRSPNHYSDAASSVDRLKQRKCIRAATQYLLDENLYDKIFCRFDVVAVDTVTDDPQIEWIQQAFEA